MKYDNSNMTYDDPMITNDWIVEKLVKLQSILNVAHNKNGRHVPQKDRSWVMGQISALREGARLDRHQMEYANEIWKEYK